MSNFDDLIKYPATAARARQLGFDLYFTGKPCSKGHVSVRYASSSNCVKCIEEKRGSAFKVKRGDKIKRSKENQLLAELAIESGFLHYESDSPCPKGHYTRWVTSNNCVQCDNESRIKRKESARWLRIKKEYGLTKKQVSAMLEGQGGKCSICQCCIKNGYHIDHCHAKNFVRSLLCSRCNQAIGLLDEDLEKIKSAMKYIKRFQKDA